MDELRDLRMLVDLSSLKALGLDINVWRSDIDDKIVVHIDTSDLPPGDTHDSGVPDIRVGVNDSYSEIGPDGKWENADD